MLYPLSSDGGVEVIGKNLEKCYSYSNVIFRGFTKLRLQTFRGLSKSKNRLSKGKLRVGFSIFTPLIDIF